MARPIRIEYKGLGSGKREEKDLFNKADFKKVIKRQENSEGCSGDHDGSVPSQGLTPFVQKYFMDWILIN